MSLHFGDHPLSPVLVLDMSRHRPSILAAKLSPNPSPSWKVCHLPALRGCVCGAGQADPAVLPSIPVPRHSPCMCPDCGPCLHYSPREALVHRQEQPPRAHGTIGDQDRRIVSQFTQWVVPAMGRYQRHNSLPAVFCPFLSPLTVMKAVQGFPQCSVTRTGQLFGTGSFW